MTFLVLSVFNTIKKSDFFRISKFVKLTLLYTDLFRKNLNHSVFLIYICCVVDEGVNFILWSPLSPCYNNTN